MAEALAGSNVRLSLRQVLDSLDTISGNTAIDVVNEQKGITVG